MLVWYVRLRTNSRLLGGMSEVFGSISISLYVNKFCVHPKVQASHTESCSQKEEDLFFWTSYKWLIYSIWTIQPVLGVQLAEERKKTGIVRELPHFPGVRVSSPISVPSLPAIWAPETGYGPSFLTALSSIHIVSVTNVDISLSV